MLKYLFLCFMAFSLGTNAECWVDIGNHWVEISGTRQIIAPQDMLSEPVQDSRSRLIREVVLSYTEIDLFYSDFEQLFPVLENIHDVYDAMDLDSWPDEEVRFWINLNLGPRLLQIGRENQNNRDPVFRGYEEDNNDDGWAGFTLAAETARQRLAQQQAMQQMQQMHERQAQMDVMLARYQHGHRQANQAQAARQLLRPLQRARLPNSFQAAAVAAQKNWRGFFGGFRR